MKGTFAMANTELVEELTAEYQNHFKDLCRSLESSFSPLPAEDLAQEAFLQTLQNVRRTAFRPENGWLCWLQAVARHRGVDMLRKWQHEKVSLEGLAGSGDDSSHLGYQVQDPGSTPLSNIVEKERRGRQMRLFSDILREFPPRS